MFRFLLTTLALLSLSQSSLAADIDTSKLIKVKGTTNQKCVEYFRFKGESYCSTTQLTSNTPDSDIEKYEKLNIKFDDRAWQPAWSKHDSRSYTIEYVPLGDKVENWNELITSQYFAKLKNDVSPMELAAAQIKQLQKKGYDPVVNIIESDDSQLIYEFRIESPKNQVQDELQKILKTPNGVFILHYSIKQADMGEQQRDKWVKNLKESVPK